MCVGLYINIRWHEFVWVYMCVLCVCVYCGAQITCAHYTCAQCMHVCGSGMCGEKGARVAESQRSPGKCYSAMCGYRATLSRERS